MSQSTFFCHHPSHPAHCINVAAPTEALYFNKSQSHSLSLVVFVSSWTLRVNTRWELITLGCSNWLWSKQHFPLTYKFLHFLIWVIFFMWVNLGNSLITTKVSKYISINQRSANMRWKLRICRKLNGCHWIAELVKQLNFLSEMFARSRKYEGVVAPCFHLQSFNATLLSLM